MEKQPGQRRLARLDAQRAEEPRSSRLSILNPNNPPIDLPSWNYVTATGNVNSKKIEDALNTYIGQVVLFPMFDLTCAEDPIHAQVKVPPTLRLR